MILKERKMLVVREIYWPVQVRVCSKTGCGVCWHDDFAGVDLCRPGEIYPGSKKWARFVPGHDGFAVVYIELDKPIRVVNNGRHMYLAMTSLPVLSLICTTLWRRPEEGTFLSLFLQILLLCLLIHLLYEFRILGFFFSLFSTLITLKVAKTNINIERFASLQTPRPGHQHSLKHVRNIQICGYSAFHKSLPTHNMCLQKGSDQLL